MLWEGEPASDDPDLRLDLGIRDLWHPQLEALFDIRVIDTDAPSYRRRSAVSVLTVVLLLKGREFTVQLWRIGEETLHLLFCQLMACCSVRPYTLLTSICQLSLQVREAFFWCFSFCPFPLQFSLVRSASMCLRGSRIKWRSGLRFDDGAPLQFVIQWFNSFLLWLYALVVFYN